MKLPIKKEYFDLIKEGLKTFDVRDAHITFICEETGEQLKKEVVATTICNRDKEFLPDVLEDPKCIVFSLARDK